MRDWKRWTAGLLCFIVVGALLLWAQGEISTGGLQVGSTGSTVNLVRVNKGVSWDAASVPTIVCADNATTVTATGAVAGDTILVNPEAAMTAGVGIGYCFATAAGGAATCRLCNPTAGAVDPAAVNVTVTIIRTR